MRWPYEFGPDPTDEDLARRRESLILTSRIGHAASLAPLILAVLFRLVSNALTRSASASSRKGSASRSHISYHQVPGQAPAKASGRTWTSTRRKLAWWLTDEISFCGTACGRRDEWILGLAWAAWLLTLTIHGTKRDYILFTKRFASVAVSQLPIHYLLSLKYLNPYVWAFNSSHELINRYHRLLGILLYSLFLCHILLFNNYLVQVGGWTYSLSSSQPTLLLGHVLSLSFQSLAVTSLAGVRRFSYRVFFIVHVSVATVVPILVFFHAIYARIYIIEALSALLLDLAARKWSTVVAKPSSLDLIPGTNLVKISVPLPPHKAEAYRSLPASHIYLSIPSSKSPIFQFLFNPFTVASVWEQKDRTSISLITRRRSGPMTNALASLTCKELTPLHQRCKLRLAIEGPYGAVGKHFQDLLTFSPSHILFIAGGVGATFAIPLYKAVLSELPMARIQFIWAVRTLKDAAWAFPDSDDSASVLGSDAGSESGLDPEFLALSDENIQLYATKSEEADDTLPLRFPPGSHGKRPHIQAIVDETFHQSPLDRIAVLVCGPTEMARDVTQHVRPWVMKGRDIWFHQESFGW